MGSVAAVLLGLTIGTFGFLVMRNPMKLALLSSQEGYYQRMVLDTSLRIQLRVFGVLLCLFGSVIFTASLGSALRVSLLKAVSDGLLVLMGLIFFVAWSVGLILTIRQLVKGDLFKWWRMWKVGTDLGPIDVFPPVTPKMQPEARFFTIALISLAVVSAIAALLHRLV